VLACSWILASLGQVLGYPEFVGFKLLCVGEKLGKIHVCHENRSWNPTSKGVRSKGLQMVWFLEIRVSP
jgi:hypothetical protein